MRRVSQTTLEEAVYWRGAYLQAYAKIEQALQSLLVRSMMIEDYRRFGPPPYKFMARLGKLGQILRAKGPLGPYAEPARLLMAVSRAGMRYRAALAHDWIEAVSGTSRSIYLNTYCVRGNEGLLIRHIISLDKMRSEADKITGLAAEALPKILEICELAGLPAIETEEHPFFFDDG